MALQLSATHCPHVPQNAQALLLPLPKVLGTTHTSLRVTGTSQGPVTRSSLCHLPISPCHYQGPNNQTLAMAMCIASISLESGAGLKPAQPLLRE